MAPRSGPRSAIREELLHLPLRRNPLLSVHFRFRCMHSISTSDGCFVVDRTEGVLLLAHLVLQPILTHTLLAGCGLFSGVTGGFGYICVFSRLRNDRAIPAEWRASSMGLTSLATNFGVSIASLISIGIDACIP